MEQRKFMYMEKRYFRCRSIIAQPTIYAFLLSVHKYNHIKYFRYCVHTLLFGIYLYVDTREKKNMKKNTQTNGYSPRRWFILFIVFVSRMAVPFFPYFLLSLLTNSICLCRGNFWWFKSEKSIWPHYLCQHTTSFNSFQLIYRDICNSF